MELKRNQSYCAPKDTELRYREALELYRTTNKSCAEISRICNVSRSGFQRYISCYHRDLLLARYDIICSEDEACNIKLGQLRGQLPSTRAKYKDAIEACENLDYIELNISQIAREFGLNGTNLGRQLRTHYPGVIEWREMIRERLGISDNLSRGTRRFCMEQYAKAVELLRSDHYITMREAAETCGVSYAGLEQHLLFYHKDLVKQRIMVREEAVGQKYKGKITGRGTVHAPLPETVQKYAEAVRLYGSTMMSVAQIARKTGISKKRFYAHLNRWHLDLVCMRKDIPYEEGTPIEWSMIRKYNPSTKAKYAEGISRLKESGLPIATIAAECGLHPDTFRAYLKEHEPELYARNGMVRGDNGKMMARQSIEKYGEAVHLYATTTESLKSLAKRFGFNDCSFGQYMRRQFPEVVAKHKELVCPMKKLGE